jgi:hypothetical protein
MLGYLPRELSQCLAPLLDYNCIDCEVNAIPLPHHPPSASHHPPRTAIQQTTQGEDKTKKKKNMAILLKLAKISILFYFIFAGSNDSILAFVPLCFMNAFRFWFSVQIPHAQVRPRLKTPR